MSNLIWAPELHHIDGKWYIYFVAAHTQALDELGMFQHRMYAIECSDADPLTGKWVEKGQIKTPFDTFCSALNHAASWNPELVQAAATAIGREARARVATMRWPPC